MKTSVREILFFSTIGLLLFSCEKSEKRIVASTITVDVQVVDEYNVPIDSVIVILNEYTFMYTPLSLKQGYTTESGEFLVCFSPKKLGSSDDYYWSYYLTFKKEGYTNDDINHSEYSIDLYTDHQRCSIILNHK
jgi:hypothetical protein